MGVTLREKKISGDRVSLYLDFYYKGRRWFEFLDIQVHKTRPTPREKRNRQLAVEIKIRREHELLVENHGLFDRQKKHADFIDFFEGLAATKKSGGNRATTLHHLKLFAGNQYLPIHNITAAWMKEFERFLLKSVSANSALSYLANVNAALNELVRLNTIARNPWHEVPRHERLKKKKTLPTAWTMDQLQKLANTPCNIETQFKQVYMFACATGLRWSDANKLTWENIIRNKVNDREDWFIDFQQQKTGSVEHLPLSEQAIEILKEREQRIKQNGLNRYVFPEARETDAKNKPVHGRVSFGLKRWAKAAGLNEKKMKFHTARHSFATNMLECTNGDLYTVSKLLGHKSIQTTEIYAQVRDARKQEAVRSLPKLDLVQINNSCARKQAA